MSRLIAGPLAAAISASSAIWGESLVLEARDGERVGFTTLDLPQTVDLGLGEGDEVCSAGMTVSAVTLSAGLDASFAEITGPLGPVLTRAAVEGGRWTDARAWLLRVSPSAAGIVPVLAGKVREARVEGLRWIIEIRNQADALNQNLGREVSAYCDAEFADDRCNKDEPWIAGTVASVADAMRFVVDVDAEYPADWFNLGRVRFVDGDLAGVASDLIFDWVPASATAGAVTLFMPLTAAPAIGDAIEIRRGCAKTRGACIAYENIVNFRGFPDAPGSEQLLRPANPGS